MSAYPTRHDGDLIDNPGRYEDRAVTLSEAVDYMMEDERRAEASLRFSSEDGASRQVLAILRRRAKVAAWIAANLLHQEGSR